MQTETSLSAVSRAEVNPRRRSSSRRRPGLQKPRVGNGTYEDLLAIVATFEAITDEDVDRLHESIVEERKIRRQMAQEKTEE